MERAEGKAELSVLSLDGTIRKVRVTAERRGVSLADAGSSSGDQMIDVPRQEPPAEPGAALCSPRYFED